MNYHIAVRQSLFHKIALYLQSDSRDMSQTIDYTDGVATKTFGITTYGILPKEDSEELFYPGINISFLDEVDNSSGRSKAKRYIVPVKITICKDIEGNTTPTLASVEALTVREKVLEALSDKCVQIWDYTDTPINTGNLAFYHDQPYRLTNESLSIPGGDVRYCITIFINYADKSF